MFASRENFFPFIFHPWIQEMFASKENFFFTASSWGGEALVKYFRFLHNTRNFSLSVLQSKNQMSAQPLVDQWKIRGRKISLSINNKENPQTWVWAFWRLIAWSLLLKPRMNPQKFELIYVLPPPIARCNKTTKILLFTNAFRYKFLIRETT